MAITPKPKPKEEIQTNVDAIIAKGGSVANSPTEKTLETADTVGAFTLRVPIELLNDLDTHRKSRRVKVSRQQWILEAIEQRLESEKSETQ